MSSTSMNCTRAELEEVLGTIGHRYRNGDFIVTVTVNGDAVSLIVSTPRNGPSPDLSTTNAQRRREQYDRTIARVYTELEATRDDAARARADADEQREKVTALEDETRQLRSTWTPPDDLTEDDLLLPDGLE